MNEVQAAAAAPAGGVVVAGAEAAKNIPAYMIDGLYKGKYNIYPPEECNYAERTEFLRSLCGHIDHQETLEEVIAKSDVPYTPEATGEEAIYQLKDMAQVYLRYKNKGARLPKFSRWVTGMFAGNAEFAKLLADEGQRAAKRKIIMSVEAFDILRCADTPHFASCFAKPQPGVSDKYGWQRSGFDKIPKRIVEECPGIGIIYVDDENGKMMGRHWMHHAKLKETGEDICVLTPGGYGCLRGNNIARLLHEKGVRVAVGSYSYGRSSKELRPDQAYVEYVGCFTKNIHHDLDTWSKNPVVQFVTPNLLAQEVF